MFNLRHSQLRNEVERIFGVLKRRFRILAVEPEYPFKTQVNLVIALTALHNFIKSNPGEIDIFEDIEDPVTISNPPESSINEGIEDDFEAKELRENIAFDMWNDYQLHRNR